MTYQEGFGGSVKLVAEREDLELKVFVCVDLANWGQGLVGGSKGGQRVERHRSEPHAEPEIVGVSCRRWLVTLIWLSLGHGLVGLAVLRRCE